MGLEVVVGSSGFVTGTNKTITATCPTGKRVLGAGGSASGLTSLVLQRFAPNPALTSVTARAVDHTHSGSDWEVSAYAICAKPPPGLQLVTAQSVRENEELQMVTANCPAGKNLVGTGANIDADADEVIFDDVRPNVALSSVTVTGTTPEIAFGGPWSATAHAICANP